MEPLFISIPLSPWLYFLSLFPLPVFSCFCSTAVWKTIPYPFNGFRSHFASVLVSWDLALPFPSAPLPFPPSPLYLIYFFPSDFFWPQGERSKCLLVEQGKQFVYTSLLLFHIAPQGDMQHLLLKRETRHMHVVTHSEPTVTNTNEHTDNPN